MKIRYLIECDCGSVMKCEESEYIEELEYTLSTFVCPKCHKAIKVSVDANTVALREDWDDCEEEDCEGEDDYGEHQEGHILPN